MSIAVPTVRIEVLADRWSRSRATDVVTVLGATTLTALCAQGRPVTHLAADFAVDTHTLHAWLNRWQIPHAGRGRQPAPRPAPAPAPVTSEPPAASAPSAAPPKR